MARVNIPSISLGPNLQKNLPAGGQGLPTTSTPGQTPSKSQGSNLRMSQGVQGGYIPDSTPRWRNVGPTLAMVGNGWQKVGISLCFEWLANWLAKCWPNVRTIVGNYRLPTSTHPPNKVGPTYLSTYLPTLPQPFCAIRDIYPLQPFL